MTNRDFVFCCSLFRPRCRGCTQDERLDAALSLGRIPSCYPLSRRWDLPVNASKSHHLSIGGHPDDRVVLSEEANGDQMTKCEQINDLGVTMNSAFIPSANVLITANKARGMLCLIKRSFACLTKEIFLSLQWADAVKVVSRGTPRSRTPVTWGPAK